MNQAQPYHHGNLREALIEAACDAVAQQGYEALSLRALAEVLGVARSAPYRHFPEKNALLAEVAQRGFGQLTQRLNEIAATSFSPRERLIAAGRAFLEFVQRNPQLFRLMYEAQLIAPATPHPGPAESMADIYQQMEQLYQHFVAEASPAKRQLRMITLWSTLYGYAKIRQAGILQSYMTAALNESEIEAAVLEFMVSR
ncbi:MAG: TetR/AcrR family transcriptional regulator [Pseudomonadota bacterium]